MSIQQWWQKPLRIIQYNLQQKDAPLMNPEKIAQETVELGANCITINAGGIVAWYPSKVAFHHINEYMGERNILKELLDACHAKGIKVIARFDFLVAQDDIYQQNPHWFARTVEGAPIIAGAERPGQWNLLYMTCPNGGYQNEEVAVPVINEILKEYDVDGYFWNGGYSIPCWCDVCKEKYLNRYGKPIPKDIKDFEADWLSSINTITMQKIWNLISEKAPEKAFVRYNFPFGLSHGGERTPPDNIVERMKCGNMVCTEAQDILSNGREKLPAWNMGMTYMKMAQKIEGIPAPVLIIHTCPGMDWRHTSLPVPEFRYWSAQALASGSNLWFSMTGFADVIPDKRILESITEINQIKMIVDREMEGALCESPILLLCDDSGDYAQGWATALNRIHVEFDMISGYLLTSKKIKDYSLVIIAKKFAYPKEADLIFEEYVANGGFLIVEGTSGTDIKPVLPLLGVKGQVTASEQLEATYMRIEPKADILQKKIGNNDLIQLRGRVGFCVPNEASKVYTTWVPPFAPTFFAGLPPERASLPMPYTKVPLCIVSNYKNGRVMFLPYEPSMLIEKYGLLDMYNAIDGYIDMMLGDRRNVKFLVPYGVMTSVFRKDSKWMIHFVNGIGQRPLMENIPCHHIGFSINLKPEQSVRSVKAVVSQKKLKYEVKDSTLSVDIAELNFYEMICVELSDSEPYCCLNNQGN